MVEKRKIPVIRKLNPTLQIFMKIAKRKGKKPNLVELDPCL